MLLQSIMAGRGILFFTNYKITAINGGRYLSVLKSYQDSKRKTAPSKTYRLLKNSISGMIDGRQAVEQAIELMLSTERWRYAIFSADYGYELPILWGESERPTVELLRLMTEEALLEDDRILSIADFNAEITGETAQISFVAKTVFGDISVERSDGVV